MLNGHLVLDAFRNWKIIYVRKFSLNRDCMLSGKRTNRHSNEQRIRPGKGSVRLSHVNVGSCNGCDIETLALKMFDYEFVDDVQTADVIIACGAVTKPIKPIFEQILNKTGNIPVVAVGTCAISGRVFRGEKVLGPIDAFTPTKVYVFGCPPHPREIMRGISMALKREAFCRA